MGGVAWFFLDIRRPSEWRFTMRDEWEIRGVRVGVRYAKLLPDAFWSKLHYIYGDLRTRLRSLCIRLDFGMPRGIWVVPPENILAVRDVLEETRNMLYLWLDNLKRFLSGKYVDPNFLKVYRNPRGGSLNVEKLRRDYYAFMAKIERIARAWAQKLNLSSERDVEQIRDEILRRIIEIAETVPRDFKYYIVTGSFELNAILSNLDAKTRKELLEKYADKVQEMLDESAREVAGFFKEKLIEVFGKEVVSRLNSDSENLRKWILKTLEEYIGMLGAIDRAYHIVKFRKNMTIWDMLKVLMELKASLNESIVKTEIFDDRFIRNLKELREKIEKLNAKLPTDLRRALQEVRNIGKLTGDEEIVSIVDSILRFEQIREETIASIKDPEIRRLVEQFVAK